MTIEFVLNGKPVSVRCDPLTRLLDLLRIDLELTGPKEGCGEGECGACAVILNDRLVNSCITPAALANGATVMTIEGLRETDRYAVYAEAYAKAGAVQCGFCTPGFVMATEALLRTNPLPTDPQIREGLSGNLCRCTGYNMIVEAVRLASVELSGSDGQQ